MQPSITVRFHLDYSKKIKKKKTVQAKPGDYRNIAKPVKNNGTAGSQKAATKPLGTPAQNARTAAAKNRWGSPASNRYPRLRE